jgi:tRNA pseudouridine13 synthase
MRTKQIPEDFIVEELIEIPALKEKGSQTYFWLIKRNWTTEAAIRAIAKKCGVSQRRFKFAGSKDKFALTKQLISAFKVPKEKLEKVKLKGIRIEFVGFGDVPISLGTLKGNKFEITIRNLSQKEVVNLKKNLRYIRKFGFRNYFGEQRFGKGNTHIVGKHILKGALEEAVKEIICFTGEKESKKFVQFREKARKLWGNWGELVKLVPRNLHLELSLLRWLAKPQNKNDFAGALRTLPKHIRKLYVNAYQSWLWNTALSSLKRVSKTKLPLPGYKTKLGKDSFSLALKSLLKKDGLTLANFKCARMPELAVEGENRKAIVKPKRIKINALENDELNKGRKKVKLTFELPRGSYATVLLESLA